MCEELALFLIFQIPSLISVGRIRVERIGAPTEGQIEEKCQSFFGKSDNDVFDGHFNHKNLNDVCVAKTAASAAKVTVFVHMNHTTVCILYFFPYTVFENG